MSERGDKRAELERENRALRTENKALREELERQWGYNHSEHCDRVWPHAPGDECYWPKPSL